MATPCAIHHQFLRPSILHILRAAGYQSTKPSVLDTLTDIAARYIALLATTTAKHALVNHEDDPEITIQDVRMAMQDCGVLGPERILAEQGFGTEEEEDMRGVESFIEWAMGKDNKEIRRIGLEGLDDGAEDYLTVLKKKHDKTEDGSRYHGTIFGEELEPREILIEGGEVSTIQEWSERRMSKTGPHSPEENLSRRQSSDLSSIGDQSMDGMDFD